MCDSVYQKFIQSNFPLSGCIGKEETDRLFNRVVENNIVSDIFIKYIKTSSMPCVLSFLEDYQIQLNYLLLFIPINENNSINFCMRAAIEHLLKFLYSIDNKEHESKIKLTNFRHLKERLLDPSSPFKDLKLEVGKLVSFYGEFSNYVHHKRGRDEPELEYMQSIISQRSFNFNTLDNKLITILNSYETIICNTFKISKRTLTVSEQMRIRNNLTGKRADSIFTGLYSGTE